MANLIVLGPLSPEAAEFWFTFLVEQEVRTPGHAEAWASNKPVSN